jgi:2-C-methyl-D-erythritol 4-phosphate cytidylyltransferase
LTRSSRPDAGPFSFTSMTTRQATVTAVVLVHPDQAALDVVVDGQSLLIRCISALRAAPCVGRVVVGTPVSLMGATEQMCAGVGVEVLSLGLGEDPVSDLTRALLTPDIDVLVVHDGARGMVGASLVEAVVAEVRDGAAACAPLVGVTDTVKQVVDGRVLATVDRTTLVSLQTPQAFSVAALRPARASDSGSLLLLDVDGDVRFILGSPEAQRIPVAEAGVLAEALLRWRQVTEING